MTDIIYARGVTIQTVAPATYGAQANVQEWTFNAQTIEMLRGDMGLAYSFSQVTAGLTAPGFQIDMGYGAAPDDAGITVQFDGDRSSVMTGADGKAITSVSMKKNGTIKVSLLKNSPANALLTALHAITISSPETVAAQGTIVVRLNA